MKETAAALLAGPHPGASSQPGWTNVILCVPLVVLCGFLSLAFLAGVAEWHLADAALPLMRAVAVALCATLASLALAVRPALSGPGLFWLVPLWLAPSVGVAGWSLLPVPPGMASDVARAAVLSLPLMVLLLSGAWAGLPKGMSAAAASAGAWPGRVLALRLRLALPGALKACAVVWALCLGLAGAGR